jgi:methylamine dehydrogenase heavy chain
MRQSDNKEIRFAMNFLKFKVCMFFSWLLTVSSAQAFTPEIPKTEILPDNNGQEWFWITGNRIPSLVDGQAYLMGEDGRRLGQLSTGFWFNSLINAHKRNEIIAVETYFSRGTRGERSDLVVLYDINNLTFKKEIEIPPKRMNGVRNDGLVNLTEDERFLLVVNYTPAQSISIVDLENAEFVEEVETPGCSVLYAAGNRDFYSICGNGGFMQIKLGDDGRVISRTRTAPLFDPVNDFLTISASRIDDTWYFVSRQHNVYAIKMAGDQIELSEQWSLTTDAERKDEWIISGMKHTATHEASGELYVLMHQGDEKTFEGPGSHVWVYDVKTKQKIREIELEELSGSIAVSQKDYPRLYTLNYHFPVPFLVQAWVYLTEGISGMEAFLRQRAGVYSAMEGELLFYSDLVPHGGFVLNIQSW